jgi:glutamyl-tRNA synthetase
MAKVRTRFAPSPTGYLHVGHLRSALYEYAFAKSQRGEFILRIEDTDRKRLVPGSVKRIINGLKLFGLVWDEGPEVGGPFAPYIQSERTALGIYKQYADKLVSSGHAYYCFCPPQTKEEIAREHEQKKIKLRDQCRKLTEQEVKQKLEAGVTPAIRLRVPDNETITYHDFVLDKEISWESRYIDEVMLLKSDGFPTYHLAAMVDDFLMKTSHIIRGFEWMSSTPAHILIFRFLGITPPEIGHLTAILDPSGGKLSKRKGAVSVEEFLADGYLSEALLNFVMLLGWAPKDNQEIFTLEEFVKAFPKGNLQISNPVFDRKKLDWFNGYYIRKKTDEELLALLRPFAPKGAREETLKKIVPLVKERMTKLSELAPFAGFFFARPKVDPALFKDLPFKKHLKEASEVLKKVENWTNDGIQEALGKLIEEEGWKTGDFYMSFRIALSGSRFTPPITESAEILGQEETLARLFSLI